MSNAKSPFASKECVHCRVSEPDTYLNFLKYFLLIRFLRQNLLFIQIAPHIIEAAPLS